jgi:hypothetical protein
MWPEYPIKSLVKRNLYLFHNNQFIDKHGVVTNVSSFQEFIDFMYQKNAFALSVEDIVDDFEWLNEAVDAIKQVKVICNKGGSANMIRVKCGNSTRWLVNRSMWMNDEDFAKIADRFLEELELFFVHMGTGVCITPGSTGQTHMILVWQEERFKKQTCVSIGVEKYLRDHSIGGVVMTLQNGTWEESMKLDESANFLSHWTVEPTGAAMWFNSDRVSRYATYFAECSITINNTLPMGLFPIRGKQKRIFYPTEEGTYETHLWKEHIQFAETYGCEVRIHGGAGWDDLTSDPGTWASRIFWKKQSAPTDTIAKWCKGCYTGAIGHHGMSRVHYYLAPDNKEYTNSIVLINKQGEPLCYGIVEEPDEKSAYLLHFQRHTASMAALGSLEFAINFAEEGRLIQVFHDSALIIEKDERHRYVARHSNEALEQPPGSWLYELLSPCTVDKKGGVESPQYSRHIGRKR